MDTLKDKQVLEGLLERGNGPWRVWEFEEPDGHELAGSPHTR